MKQRVITAIVLVLCAIPVCIFSGTVIFPIAMAFIGFMGVYERSEEHTSELQSQ